MIYILRDIHQHEYQICTYKDDELYFCGSGDWYPTIPICYNTHYKESEYDAPGWWDISVPNYTDCVVIAEFETEEELYQWYDDNPEQLI